MRFSNVEVERAYSDYLDSLEDWPPPTDEFSAELVAALARTAETNRSNTQNSPPRAA